jgi:DNA-binding MarR family transcriptional regulator
MTVKMSSVVEDRWTTAVDILRLASQLVDGIQEGLARRGFDDVRPAHGFIFVRISSGDATTSDIADHLGVTKQAAAQLVEYLVHHGYVVRHPDPQDGRARHVVLTQRGRACTAAAEAAAAETVQGWAARLGRPAFEQLQGALRVITSPGRLRPSW